MKQLNDCGVFTDYSVLKSDNKNRESLTICYGEYKDKWGFVIDCWGRQSGGGGPLTIMSMKFSTKNQMFDAALEKAKELSNEHLSNHKILGHLEYLVFNAKDSWNVLCISDKNIDTWTNVFSLEINQMFKTATEHLGYYVKQIKYGKFLVDNPAKQIIEQPFLNF